MVRKTKTKQKWNKRTLWFINLRFVVVEDDKSNQFEHTLEEAIEATSELFKKMNAIKWYSNEFGIFIAIEIGKYQTILICLTGVSIMGAALENVNLSYVLPYAKCDLKLSLSEQGVLTSVSFLGIVSTSYLWGFLVDCWGRQKVLCAAAFCGFGFSFASGFATNISVLIFLRFMAGALWVDANISYTKTH